MMLATYFQLLLFVSLTVVAKTNAHRFRDGRRGYHFPSLSASSSPARFPRPTVSPSIPTSFSMPTPSSSCDLSPKTSRKLVRGYSLSSALAWPDESLSPVYTTTTSRLPYVVNVRATADTSTETLAASFSAEIFNPSSVPRVPLGPGSVSGKNALSQADTNGQSLLGTLDAPKFEPFIGGLNTSTSFPWGNRTVAGTNPYSDMPTTGITRTYDFVITRATIAPDGVERAVLLVNDQFPGPTIEADWGDTIQVTVTNSLSDSEEGTSLHWHGLLQSASQWMDGVPGIQQCPIAPGSTFTYSFLADLYGTSWWHAHYSAQYAGGLFGAMIIHGPTDNTEAIDLDLGPVLLTDYYHEQYFDIVEGVMGTDLSADLIAPESINNLINGKGDFNCSLVTDNTTCTSDAGLAKFQFTTGSTHRLRLINAGAEGIQKFSIDDHIITVIAYDFVPIVPYNTTIVTLGVGQRADVVVLANGSSSDSYWMRSTISTCSRTTQPDGLAIIYYPSANTSATPTTSAWTDDTSPCANDDLANVVPYYSITPTATPATSVTLTIGAEVNDTGHFVWTVNNSTFRVDYNDPILLLANEGNTSYPYDPEWNVYDFGSNSSIQLIVYNPTGVAHPMHLHGHNMFVLASGTGTTWDGTIVNADNPTRRDVQLLEPEGYIVIQFDADNPGVWPFHCHIAWHVSGGLYVNILERPADIAQLNIPSSINDTCSAWYAYTNVDIVDQIDSGL